MDAQVLTVPLWGALAVGGGILSTSILTVTWVFTNFAKKKDLEMLAGKVDSHAVMLSKVASDVSYIRGRIEPK